MLSALSATDVVCLIIGALGIGVSKSGWPGISMLHVVLYAEVFGAKPSTGVLLPMLIVGDLCAIGFFGRQAVWKQIQRLLPPTLIGIVIGWQMMGRMDDSTFKVIVGLIILILSGVQALRMARKDLFDAVPHQMWFAILLGLLGGITTMLANAAGPVIALYLLAVKLPKWQLIGTSAWLFLVLNVCKLPLSFQLGLITPQTLMVGASFAIAIPIGMLSGRALVKVVSQTTFNAVLLAFTAIAALRLIGIF